MVWSRIHWLSTWWKEKVPDHPKWEIDYKTDLFHHEEIKSLYASIICLLNDGIKYPDRKIEELNIIDSYEEKKQLNFFSKTEKRCNGQVIGFATVQSSSQSNP